jgi:hypothetical protein
MGKNEEEIKILKRFKREKKLYGYNFYRFLII